MSTRERSKHAPLLLRLGGGAHGLGRRVASRPAATAPSAARRTAPASSSRDERGGELGLRQLGRVLSARRLDRAVRARDRVEHLRDLVDLDVPAAAKNRRSPTSSER